MSLPPDKTTPPPDTSGDYSFTAPDHRLISAYLRRRIAGDPLPPDAATIFRDADIYAAEPAALTAGLLPAPARKGEAASWFFFTHVKAKSSNDSRKSRTVGGGVGTWHNEHAPEHVVDDEGNRVGHRQYFSYMRKNGKKSERTGWCMMEYVDDQEADHEGRGGADSVMVLCKIYRSCRADGSASKPSSRSARKRKEADGRVGQASAPVRRRLFGSPAPTPPAASQDKMSATSEAGSEPEASRSVLSFWSEPEASQDKIGATSEPRSEPEASKDTSRSILSFWSEPEAPQVETASFDWSFPMASSEAPALTHCYGMTNLMDRAPGAGISDSWLRGDTTVSCSGDIVPTSQQDKSSTTSESLPSSLMPQLEAPQCETETMDLNFLMASSAPPALEHCYGGYMPGTPMCSPGARPSASWTGCDITSYCFGEMGFPGSLPTHDEWGIVGSEGAWYMCSPAPSAHFLPRPAPSSSWSRGSDLSDGWLREPMPWTVA